MDIINNKKYTEERSLYNIKDATIINSTFVSAIGESPLKESKNVIVKECDFSIRYPLWHVSSFTLDNITMDELTRASLWYCDNGNIINSKLHGTKAIRECNNIKVDNCDIISDEFGWKSNNLTITNSSLKSVYPFLMSNNLSIESLNMDSKYSFQYASDFEVKKSNLNTKDAFWHATNGIIEDTYIKSEYIGWYSKNLTFKNCIIEGTQPFCYCENLKLIDCKMVGCDLAFEYSTVDASIIGDVISIKNPLGGKIICDGVKEIIRGNEARPCSGEIIIRKKGN